MLPIERQHQILDWLTEEGTLTITEISKRLNVSEMTVYRDIKPLLEENKIDKTSRGISLSPILNGSSNICTYCLKELNNRHPVQIIRHDQKVEQLCCPHCGLLRCKEIKKMFPKSSVETFFKIQPLVQISLLFIRHRF
jgi:DeoR/GlpR family transcriptional regulator of sugar metabolism